MIVNEKGFWQNADRLEYCWSPLLANWIATILTKDRPVYDFGCGAGDYSAVLTNHGFNCIGFEGDPMPLERRAFKGVLKVDIAAPMEYLSKWKKGHVICLEVMEHIPEKYMRITLDNIARICNGRLVLSWAVVGQGGYGHINEMNNEDCIPIIEAVGFKKNDELTVKSRKYVDHLTSYFRNTVMIFDRI